MLNSLKIARTAASCAAALTLVTLAPFAIAPASAQMGNGAPQATYGPVVNPYAYRLLRRTTNTRRNYNRRNNAVAATTTNPPKSAKVSSKPTLNLKTILAQLNLTDAQKSKTDFYQAKADAAGKAAYADRTLSSNQFIGRMDQIHTDLMSDIKAILTAGQQTRFDALMAKVK